MERGDGDLVNEDGEGTGVAAAVGRVGRGDLAGEGGACRCGVGDNG